MAKIRLIWKCELCEDIVISYSHIRHDMNTCEYGKDTGIKQKGVC